VTKIHTVALDIDPTALRFLARGEMRVALAKSPLGTPPSVVWLAWDPLARNTISWTEAYAVFAAHVPDQSDGRIHLIGSPRWVRQKTIHVFTGTAFRGASRLRRIPWRHYEVRNQASFAAAFGLMQTATVNGPRVTSPVNYAVLPPGFVADFAVSDTLHFWLARRASSGSIIARSLPAVSFALPRLGEIARYRYDEQRGFVAVTTPDRSHDPT
jgi:hypothetical protein